MLEVLTFVLAATAAILVLQYLADRTGLPAAALLTVAGLVYGVLPGPNVTLDPHVILTFVIPPLIYSAVASTSPMDRLITVRMFSRMASSEEFSAAL